MKRPATPLLVHLHVCSPAVFPMSPDHNILILALSYLTGEILCQWPESGGFLKPWHKFTWHVDLGRINASTGRLSTPKGTSCTAKDDLCLHEVNIYCAETVLFTVCFPAVEKPKLWGVVLRFGPTGESQCKQVLSGLPCVTVANNPKNLLPLIQPPLVKLRHTSPVLSVCVCGLPYFGLIQK